nr:hypothetical protein BHI3_20260 [Bacteriovorax sp. HI3]
MDKHQLWTYILTVISTLIAVVSLVATLRSDWRIAELSGAFDKSKIGVYIGDYLLPENQPLEVIIGASELSEKTTPVIASIPFILKSEGERSSESLILTFQYKDIFQREKLNDLEMGVTGSFDRDDLKKTFSKTDEMSYVNYKIKALNPGTKFMILEPLFLGNTKIEGSSSAKTKDGYDMKFKFSANVMYRFNINFQAKDTYIKNYPVSISVDKASTIQDLYKGRLQELIEVKRKEIREQVGFFKYLVSLVFSKPKRNIFLVYIPLKEQKIGSSKIYLGISDFQVAKIEYDLLLFRFLFF